ncbi:trifunctional glycosyltransferase/class I SAM-dependent methyltransferase/polysaccharide deacetylase [Synechococcus sp. CS-1327]|uniref:trifunctional glycosyltransferase/class I SAM-dependent methyltransferase/polysaccharide deacetylase n=1 Tax=Synechococcus sp. CS-1327 TaxID=2847977 RepID=UPI00223AC450|nr:trifunctional glycosyltransferase/class I SAM-dependent methyltransferase/polysaccharide deacetylase [Synechococcus sp. CS-1327]
MQAAGPLSARRGARIPVGVAFLSAAPPRRLVSNKPRTSFVIPARNAARTLAQTLDCLLAQGDADWEALIVDDGSSDPTPELITSYAQRDRRFVALRGSGSEGVSAARNTGLGQACGRFVVFLDSDDWIHPAFLRRMHAALEAAPGAAVAYCDYHRVMPDGAWAPVHSDPLVAQAPFETFARTCAVAIHAVVIERELVLRAGSFDTSLRTCEDWDLWQRVSRLGAAWVHVPKPLAFYRTSEQSLSQDTARVLADAAVVIHRGFACDPRLQDPAPAHASGASRAHGITPELALAYFVLWFRALDAARGVHQSELGELLGDDLPAETPYLATTLLDGLTVGLRAVPSQLAARWNDYGPHITALIDALGAIRNDPVAARRTQYAFERLVLQHDDLAAPRHLALTMGLRVDLRRLEPVTPAEGIDRFYVHLCDGASVLGVVEPGTLGTFAPQQWIELAAQCLGWKRVIGLTARSVARAITSGRFAHASRMAVAMLRCTAMREQGWRHVLKAAAQSALLTAAAPASDDGGHVDALNRLREEADPVAGPAAAAVTASSTRETGTAEDHASEGRRAFWDNFFRQPDPWNYGSAYEQEKYALQLELLPEGKVACALELACAEGRFTEKLAKRSQRLIATDISATALARAADRCSSNPHIEFRQLDLAADCLPQGVDLIVCSEVLYFLADETELLRVGQRMAAALTPGGHIITAHALVLNEEMTRTGFDWDHPWGATTICRVLAEVPGLFLERSLRTELYRIDRFVRRDDCAMPSPPLIESRPITAEIEHEVARYVVWGGAVARRTELANTERHQQIPVLAYHRIADEGPPALARYRVGAAAFAAQMSWLRKNGYHSITADELAWFLQHHYPFVGRPVMITFDDGYQDFADTAWPILRRHDFRAEVFVPTDLIGKSADWDCCFGEPAPLLDVATITALAAQGARFGSHLASHRGADGLSTRELAVELLRSRRCLAHWTGLQPCAVAAPFGFTDQRLERLAAECGYGIGFSTESQAVSLADDPMRLPRIEVRGDMALEEFVRELEACR